MRPNSPSTARRVRAAALLALLVGFALSGAASAWRKPTSNESRAISTAAQRTLHGKGWHARAIRVSTVRAKYRYATASVDNSRTGVGGEMILRRTSSGWHRIFLGTDDFCTANAPRAALRDLGFSC